MNNAKRIRRALLLEKQRLRRDKGEKLKEFEKALPHLSAVLKKGWLAICEAEEVDPRESESLTPTQKSANLIDEHLRGMREWTSLVNQYRKLCKQLGVQPYWEKERT